MGSDVTEEQAIWRDDAIMRSQSTSLVERRVRMALGLGDRRGLNTWLARLPMEAKEKDEWRYWQADLLLERGRDDEAKDILRSADAAARFLSDGPPRSALARSTGSASIKRQRTSIRR